MSRNNSLQRFFTNIYYERHETHKQHTKAEQILPISKKTQSEQQTSGRSFLTITSDEMLRDGSDNAYRQFVQDCLAFSARLLAVRDGYAKIMGVSGPQYMIMISVAHLGKKVDVTISDIAEHLHQSSSFVTNETNKLVKENLVRKDKDDIDRRRTFLTITQEGWQRFDQLSTIQPEVNNIHFGCLTTETFDQIRTIMPQLITSTDRALSLLRHRISELQPPSVE